MNAKLKEVLERVQTWPEERQEDIARLLMDIEAQDASPYQLSDEQIEDARRRLADPDPKFVSLDELRARFSRRGV